MKISVLLASRAKGNPNMRFHALMESLLGKAVNPDNFEILVKLDDDDVHHPLYIGGIDKPIRVKTIITPRAKGYADLHKAYMDLLAIASPDSELFWVLSDDVTVGTAGWDKEIINIAGIRNGRPLVINTISDIDMRSLNSSTCIGNVDTFPVWTRAWLAVAGFGYNFNTDGWTSLLCYNLETAFSLPKDKYRIFCPFDIIRGDDGDGAAHTEGDERWNGVRKWQIKRMESVMLSPNIQKMAWLTAGAMSLAIKGYD